jgi:hypothetical protein
MRTRRATLIRFIRSCFSPKRGVSFAGKINKAAVGWGRSNIPKSGRIASGLISCRINLI